MTTTLPLFKRVSEDGSTFGTDAGRKDASARWWHGRCARTHAHAGARARRAVQVSRRHGQLHRVQVLRRRVQRTERQSGLDQLAARWRDRRRVLSAHDALVSVDGLQPLRGADLFDGLPGRRIHRRTPATGIVLHSADTCIGCQYCTWNCSYGVPQYNPERGVVGKCDLCHSRLGLGQSPACVSACPTGAIKVEIVKIAEWRNATAAALPASGHPSADQSLSTTRVTLPGTLPPNARPTDLARLAPSEPHWPLIVMTVFTQLSVGAFATIWTLELLGDSTRLESRRSRRLLVGSLALGGVDAAPRSSCIRLPCAEDVAAVVAEPRSAVLHGLLDDRLPLRGDAVVGDAAAVSR